VYPPVAHGGHYVRRHESSTFRSCRHSGSCLSAACPNRSRSDQRRNGRSLARRGRLRFLSGRSRSRWLGTRVVAGLRRVAARSKRSGRSYESASQGPRTDSTRHCARDGGPRGNRKSQKTGSARSHSSRHLEYGAKGTAPNVHLPSGRTRSYPAHSRASCTMTPNPSLKRTNEGRLRLPSFAA
jgi:hypothetical protein